MSGRPKKPKPEQPPSASESQPPRKKPGPHEKLHTLYPLTFEQALERAFSYRPTKPKKKSRPGTPKPPPSN
jgi:hypothetical protein